MRKFLPRSTGFFIATAFSLAAHAAFLHWLSDLVPQPGDEGSNTPARLEIVVEDESSGAGKALQPIEAETLEAQAPAADPVAPVAPQAPLEPQQDQSATALAPAGPRAQAPVEAPETIDPVPADETFVLLPSENIPIPTARPAPPEPAPARNVNRAEPAAKRSVAKPAPAAKKAQPPRKRKTAVRNSSPGKTASSKARSEAKKPAARKASPAAKASYSHKLLRHVERRKRYPRQAASQRISGATRLSITINRSGGLVAARVSGSSGHRILDDAALSTARRAAPYPRPPEGVGGSTISFSVTLRYKR
ncbi:energy transducer TonB [Nitratireductor basaltis]|uniref:TonB family protein n=1 Tax=Nitratireductor basaltis TaxID=472175 RepID=A0A084U9K6_9HYPH|nr:energy transducer TonB [Nitratireductor basaltis]KFB09642.1 TonB family protein [Nitratireductor basaltis]